MITDDRLEQLLRETFQAHEHLADQEPAPHAAHRDLRRALVAAAAAVALVAGGAVGGVRLLARDDGSTTAPLTRQSPTIDPPSGRVLRTDAENKAETRALVERALQASEARMGDLPGVEDALPHEVAPLERLNTFVGGGDQIIRSEFFLAASPDHTSLAQYLVAHPADQFTTDGAEAGDANGGIGGGRLLNGAWADELFWNPGSAYVTDAGSVALLVQLTPVGDRTGIRVTAFGSWMPARPAASFLDDPVTSIDLRYRPGVEGLTRGPDPEPREVTITDTRTIDRVVSAYNAMKGWPEFFHSCPYSGRPEEIRATFHTSTRNLTSSWVGSCYQVWEVRSAGHRVGPYLADSGLSRMIAGLTK